MALFHFNDDGEEEEGGKESVREEEEEEKEEEEEGYKTQREFGLLGSISSSRQLWQHVVQTTKRPEPRNLTST
jgi:hypothetical protein